MNNIKSVMFIVVMMLFCMTVLTKITGILADEKISSESTETKDETFYYEDWNEGMSIAKKEKRPVIVQFYFKNDFWQDATEDTTLSAPEIQRRLAKDWVYIRINITEYDKTCIFDGKTMTCRELSRYFRMRSYPSFVFFDKNGQAVQLISGSIPFYNRNYFGLILDYMKDEAYENDITFEEYRKSKAKL